MTATTPPSFNLYTEVEEDIMENAIVIDAANNKHAFFNIEGSVRFMANPAQSMYIKISTPAEGGDLSYKVRVFGYTVRL